MIALETPLVAALNHLLDAEQWARDKLAPFSGELLELRAAPLPALRLAITEDGRVGPAPRDGAPALVVRIGPQVLAALARGEEHVMRAVDVSGNARLAGEVLLLLRHLRWDAEEDLSTLLGDVAAHRLVGAARRLAVWQMDAVRRTADGLMDYAVEERRLLLRRAELDAFAGEVARLRDALERLEKRVERAAARAGS